VASCPLSDAPTHRHCIATIHTGFFGEPFRALVFAFPPDFGGLDLRYHLQHKGAKHQISSARSDLSLPVNHGKKKKKNSIEQKKYSGE
jgi:hypothetical protein